MNIPIEVLNVGAACDPESSRYGLGGIRIERETEESLVAVATDGRMLIAASWADEEGLPTIEPVLVSADAMTPLIESVKKLPRKLRRFSRPIRVYLDEGGWLAATVAHERHRITVAPIAQEGRFPDGWRRVFSRDAEGTISITVDLQRLAQLAAAMAAIASRRINDDRNENPKATISLHVGDDGPSIVLSAAGEETQSAAVLMGITQGTGAAEGPEWTPRAAEATPATPSRWKVAEAGETQ